MESSARILCGIPAGISWGIPGRFFQESVYETTERISGWMFRGIPGKNVFKWITNLQLKPHGNMQQIKHGRISLK